MSESNIVVIQPDNMEEVSKLFNLAERKDLLEKWRSGGLPKFTLFKSINNFFDMHAQIESGNIDYKRLVIDRNGFITNGHGKPVKTYYNKNINNKRLIPQNISAVVKLIESYKIYGKKIYINNFSLIAASNEFMPRDTVTSLKPIQKDELPRKRKPNKVVWNNISANIGDFSIITTPTCYCGYYKTGTETKEQMVNDFAVSLCDNVKSVLNTLRFFYNLKMLEQEVNKK